MKKYRKKFGKKALALFLVFAMCVGMLNLTALAADSNPESANDQQTVVDTDSVGEKAALSDKESAAMESDNAVAVDKEQPKADGQEGVILSDMQVAGDNSNSDNAKTSEETIAYPVEYTENDTTYELHEDGTATVTQGKKDENDRIVVPASVTYDGKEYKVTVIGANAFAKQDDVSEIVLPDGLESIGKQAFLYDYLYDNDLIIPDSVVEIGENAFYGFHMNATSDRHIEKIILGKNLKTIGKQAFYFKSTLGNGNGLDFKVKIECYPNIESIDKTAFAYASTKYIVSEITIRDAYEGQLDTVLNVCTALKNMNKIYELGIDRNNILTITALRKAIAEAEDGEPVTLKLEGKFYTSSGTIVIPKGIRILP